MKKMKTNETRPTDGIDGRDDGISPFWAKKTRKRRFRRRFAAAVALLAALGAILAADSWRRLQRKPIDVENASTRELVGWLALRDLSVESPEVQKELFQKYFEAISASVAQDAKNDESAENDPIIEFEENDEIESNGEDAKTKKIELPTNVKRFAESFLAARYKKIAEWDATRIRPAYLRLDYVVVPQTPRTSEYVLSGDVRPGPALIERWEKSRADALENKSKRGKTGGGKPIVALEQNVGLMLMQWFNARFEEYDATPDAQKKEKIDRCADELERLQAFFGELFVDPNVEVVAPPNRADMLREFEAICEGWNEIAPIEDVAKALYFKDLMESVLAARETPLGQAAYPRRVSVSAAETTNDSPENPNVANVRRTVADAIKRFVWKDATQER